MKKLVHKLQVSLTLLQALCGTYACSSFDSKKTKELWELIHQFKKPTFTGKKYETPEVNLLEEKAEFPEAIFGVPQSQDVSDTQLRQITELLKSGADPNETDNGMSMLQGATLQNAPELVEILLEHGANPYHRSMDGMHPLAMAINLESENRLKIITALVKKGNLMNIKIPAGKNMMNIDIPETFLTPIEYALLNDNIANHDPGLVDHLASLGASVHLHNILKWAAQKGYVGAIYTLNDWIKEMPIEHKNSKNYQSNENQSSDKYRSSEVALCTAAHTGQVGATRALLAFHDIDVNACPENKPALHCAVMSRHAEVVRELLSDPRTDVNAVDKQGCQAIYLAIRYNSLADCLRELLLSPKIKIDASLLHTAVIDNNIEATGMFIKDQRIDVNEIIRDGKTTVGLIAGYCKFIGMDAYESFKLLCDDPRTVIDSNDCVCPDVNVCEKHKFLEEARIRKQNKREKECAEIRRKEQERLEAESIEIQRRECEEFQRRRRKQGGCCICS